MGSKRWFSNNFALSCFGFFLYLNSAICTAFPITLTVIQPDRIGQANSTEIFSGAITNNTGSDLLASDLFLDFSGFDPAVITVTQLLGSPDFLIADGATSSTFDFFSFTLGSNAVAGVTYFADLFVQDGSILPNTSNIVTVSVQVPEPGAFALFAAGLVAFLWLLNPLMAGRTRHVWFKNSSQRLEAATCC